MSVTIDGYEIDVFLTVEPSHNNDITQHPVESTADVTDHIISRPDRLVVTGVVSDTPIGDIADRRNFSVADDGTVTGVLPSSDAYDRLKRIHSEKRIVTVLSGVYPAFKNMAIQSLSAPNSVSTGDSLMFRAVFQQVNFVDVSIKNKTTLVALPIAKKKTRKGHKTAPKKPDTKPPRVEDNGLLKRLVRGVQAAI